MSKFFYFVMIGAPGSGKGTQGEKLASQFNLLRISPGEILRKIIKEKPSEAMSVEIRSYIDKGNLIPTELMNKLLTGYINENRAGYKGILFDGYPRSLEQDDFLCSTISPGGPHFVLYFEISLDKLLSRLNNRQVCGKCGKVFNSKHNPSKTGSKCDNCNTNLDKRADDSDQQVITNRFKVFTEQSMPIIEKYKKTGQLVTVNADSDINELSVALSNMFEKIMYV